MHRISQLNSLLVVLSVISLAGCGGGESDQPELGQVSGTVTFKGDVLPGASVSFVPIDGRPATGVTDEEGVYELVYIRNTQGCKIGQNKVMITTLDESGDSDELEGDNIVQTKDNLAQEKLPAKYNTETELIADVQSGKNTFDFRLE